MRENLIVALAKRLISFPVQIWRNLGTNSKYRKPKAIGYSLGAVTTLFAIVRLLYDFNIDLKQYFELPFARFFSEEVLPFIAAPLTYIGLDLSPPWQALLALSGIGGAVVANAEFRTKQRGFRHLFVERETGPRFSLAALEALENTNPRDAMPDPPKHTLFTRAAVFGIGFVLGYTFLGLLFFPAFLIFGLYFFWRDIVYILCFVESNVLYVGDHVLARYDRRDDSQFWGTRWSLAVFTRQRKLDELLKRYYIEFWRTRSLDPAKQNWMALRDSVEDGGRVVANAIWLSILVLVISLLR